MVKLNSTFESAWTKAGTSTLPQDGIPYATRRVRCFIAME